MKFLILGVIVAASSLGGCSGKKQGQYGAPSTQLVISKPSLSDSIDGAVYSYEQRLDIKMKRKVYEPKPGTLVTIQKWLEFGDTNRVVKLRAETLTGDTKMEVIQYHLIDGKLAEIHDYTYDKKCDGSQKQCMDEAKYYFDKDTLKLAQKRHAEGTAEHTPVIEQANFAAFQPGNSMLLVQKENLVQVNAKYASLPFPKPRPERGTPVPVQR